MQALAASSGMPAGKPGSPTWPSCPVTPRRAHPQVPQTTFVDFRWAADKQLRDAVCNFAGGSRHASPWAARLYHDAIAHGKDHPHAVRILALR